jgi:hypothetical protein
VSEAEAATRSNAAEEKSIVRWSVEEADSEERGFGVDVAFVSIPPVDGVLGIFESAEVEIGGSKV